ncbi:AAA family ATPase [Salarchaeum sp. III]|uniref:Cdc6/Cdc18 family protein n=1 Tax=Salarchaeum sp. III TaxID=3107927 RepID=UPI002ED9705B
MITDPRVFEDEHLPRELKHREGAKRVLANAFEPARQGERADDVLLSGPSGVGKTVLARHTLTELQTHADVHYAHIDCLGSTTATILRDALDAYPQPVDVHRGTPLDELVETVQDVVTQPYVLVLDEADDLPEKQIPELVASLPHVSVVAICHNAEEWLARVDDGFRQSIGAHQEVDRFSVDELADILHARAREGLTRGAVSLDQLRWIADEVSGVARRGIQSLRSAALLAEDRHGGAIRDADVDDCFSHARQRIRRMNLRSLPYHHQVLYAIIHEGAPIGSDELHRRYDSLSETLYGGQELTPVSRRARRTKLAKLREYDLVEHTGPDHDRTYVVLDESVRPRVEIRTAY